MNSITNIINKRYANNQIKISDLHSIFFKKNNLFWFPFKFNISINELTEETAAHVIRAIDPVSIGYHLLKQEFIIEYSGLVKSIYKPVESGFGANLLINDRKIIIPIKFKHLIRYKEIIKHIKHIIYQQKSLKIQDLLDSTLMYQSQDQKILFTRDCNRVLDSQQNSCNKLNIAYEIDVTSYRNLMQHIIVPASLFWGVAIPFSLESKGSIDIYFNENLHANYLAHYKIDEIESLLNSLNTIIDSIDYKGYIKHEKFKLDIKEFIYSNIHSNNKEIKCVILLDIYSNIQQYLERILTLANYSSSVQILLFDKIKKIVSQPKLSLLENKTYQISFIDKMQMNDFSLKTDDIDFRVKYKSSFLNKFDQIIDINLELNNYSKMINGFFEFFPVIHHSIIPIVNNTNIGFIRILSPNATEEKALIYVIFVVNSKEDILPIKKYLVKINFNFEFSEDKLHSFALADIALCKSGTYTLEVAASETPMVVCYKPNFFNYLLIKLFIKIKFVCLINIIADTEVWKECIGPECNLNDIYHALKRIIPKQENDLKWRLTKTKEILESLGINWQKKPSEISSEIIRKIIN